MPTWLIRTLAAGPPIALSALLWLLVLAAVPAQVALGLLLLAATGTLALWRGAGEGWASRLVPAARRLRSDELAALAPVTTALCGSRLGPPLVELLVTHNDAIAARGSGRRSVVLTSGLLDAVRDGHLPANQAVAVLAHAAGVVRTGLVRHDRLLQWWSLPWSSLGAAVIVMSWPLRRVRAAQALWRWRAVLVVVAVVQQVAQHLLVLAVATAAIGALSYAMPAWQRAWSALLVRTGDRCVVDAGYAQALAAFLRRCPSTEETRTRLRLLAGDPVPAARLALVRS